MNRLPGLAMLAAFAILLTGAARLNWNNLVSDTPEGWSRLGNPEAKVKLVEFVSYTCSHCAHFEVQASDAIRVAYVAPGLASVEMIPVMRNPVDITAALLADCGARENFFLNHTAILRGQTKWLDRLEGLGEASMLRWRSGKMPDRFKAIADDAGFYELMQSRGYERRQVDACLADTAKAERLVRQSNASVAAYGVESTPSFAINGETLADVHDWDALKPRLADALK